MHMQMQVTGFDAGMAFDSDVAPRPAEPEASMAGVLLLASFTVLLCIISMVIMGFVLTGAWWLVSHIPVPLAVQHLLMILHL
jgi:hypothetical protein